MALPIPVIVNQYAGAGRAARLIPGVVDALGRHGVVADVYLPPSEHDTRALFAEMRADKIGRIVVVGGDGMAHLACHAFVGSDTVIGMVPGGTGNDAATGLGLPTDPDQAVAAALSDPTAVDVINVGERHALSVATLGFSVAVNARADAMRFPKGSSRYTLATLVELPRLAAHRLIVTVDGTAHHVEPNLMAIANTSYFGGGMKIAPSASPTDGMLDVVIIGPAPRGAFVRLLPTVFSGRHVTDRRVDVLAGTTVEIDGPPIAVRADGEVLGQLPLTITLVRSGLLVAGAASRA